MLRLVATRPPKVDGANAEAEAKRAEIATTLNCEKLNRQKIQIRFDKKEIEVRDMIR